jgi:hypothetical protein
MVKPHHFFHLNLTIVNEKRDFLNLKKKHHFNLQRMSWCCKMCGFEGNHIFGVVCIRNWGRNITLGITRIRAPWFYVWHIMIVTSYWQFIRLFHHSCLCWWRWCLFYSKHNTTQLSFHKLSMEGLNQCRKDCVNWNIFYVQLFSIGDFIRWSMIFRFKSSYLVFVLIRGYNFVKNIFKNVTMFEFLKSNIMQISKWIDDWTWTMNKTYLCVKNHQLGS